MNNSSILSLYDSFSHKVVPFCPLDKSNIMVYFCGPTVYDFIHVGNLRSILVGDLLVRVLRHLYPKVTYVRNITDIDDKINKRAKDNGEPIESLTKRTIQDFHQDMKAMHIIVPDVEPRATDNIAQMQTLIQRLIDNSHAYVTQGHVLFSVASFKEYGQLSGRSQEKLLAGARVDIASYKKNPNDFVLWKPSDDDEPGWDSPWGRGRPGWHIECSAMSHRYLGETFDIHGGGIDLLFPHHENERAQSLCGFSGSQFAHYWIHNDMLLVDGAKMSKSLGNFHTVRELLTSHQAETLRLSLLKVHYRSVLNFTREGLHEARRIMDRLYRALAVVSDLDFTRNPAPTGILKALYDDLDTPQALAVMCRLADKALAADKQAARELYAAGRLLGLFNMTTDNWFHAGLDEVGIRNMISQRVEARQSGNYAKADAIRDQLLLDGIVLEDGPEGTNWRRL